MASADADVITLDSDEEDQGPSDQLSDLASNGGVTIRRISSANVIPMTNRPGPSGMIRPPILPHPATLPQVPYQVQKKSVPRKPGVFPPFALFSQEHRAEVLKSNGDMGFGDVGRRLGEMWHALSEDEKEGYRRRAKEISDQKMADYQESLRKMPPQQRQIAINQANAPQKRRKTHGYAIFSAEMRKNLGNAMSAQETANVIAESWRAASPTVRREYEVRAARINAAQNRRLEQAQTQQNQMLNNAHQMTRFNNANNSGLRISSVSSLSPSRKMLQQRPSLPSQLGPKPSLPAQLGPKLPSGITISRVEPEVSIVAEQQAPKVITPQQARSMLDRARGGSLGTVAKRPAISPAAAAAMRVKAQLAQRSNQMVTNGGQWSGMVGPPRGMQAPGIRRNLMRMPTNGFNPVVTSTSSLKRPLPRPVMMPQGPQPKNPRLMRPNHMPSIAHKMCRVCGLMGPPACRLEENPEILQSLTDLTLTPIDLVKDQIEGYPSEVCRRCMSLITSFTVFKKTFTDGQERLRSNIERLRPQMLPLPDDLVANIGEDQQHTQFASVDIITSGPTTEEESILPDLDLDMDFGENPANIPQPVDIKQEKIKLIAPSSDTLRVKVEIGKSMDSENIVEGGSETRVEHKKEDEKEALKTNDEPKEEKSQEPAAADIAVRKNDADKVEDHDKPEDVTPSTDDPLDPEEPAAAADIVQKNDDADKVEDHDKQPEDVAASTDDPLDFNKEDASPEAVETNATNDDISEENSDATPMEVEAENAPVDDGLKLQLEDEESNDIAAVTISNGHNTDNSNDLVPSDSMDVNSNEETSNMIDQGAMMEADSNSNLMAEDEATTTDLQEDSFVNCNSNSEQGAIDPFATDSADMTEASQDANDAFQGDSAKINDEQPVVPAAEEVPIAEVSS